jgi:ABC-type Fe3+-hydroxamate transport system substrate-binding protein
MLFDYQHILSHKKPEKLISLVPSLTETLIYCGLETKVAGRTRYCIHPEEIVKNIIKTGGTKDPDLEKITSINPDLIIATKEENRKEDVEFLAEHFPVLMGDIKDIETLIQFLKALNELLLNEKLEALISQLANLKLPCLTEPKSVLYLIWQNPMMTVGHDTFIHHMLNRIGFESVSRLQLRYPQLSFDDVKNLQPDYIFLSSEPYRFKEKHINLYRELFPEARVILVDGEMFSWYGSRLLQTPDYFINLFQKLQLTWR